MSRQTVSLGRILGIPIRLDYSWFLVFAFMTWSLAIGYYPFELRGADSIVIWGLSALTAVTLFASVLLHELGHSVVALHYRIPVNRITLFLFGGVAEIGAEPPSARAEFLIASAGPLVSFALAVAFAMVERLAGAWVPLVIFCGYLALINGSLALFNLIPGFPLDGGRIFRALVWGFTGNLNRATWLAANLGRAMAFLLIGWGMWRAVSGDIGGLWSVFIGWYLQGAAASQLEQHQVQEALSGHHVSEAMNRSYLVVRADMSLEQIAGQTLLDERSRAFVVRNDDTIAGMVSSQEANRVPRERWWTTNVTDVMLPADRMFLVEPETDLYTAAVKIARLGIRTLAVISNGRILGTLDREALYGFMQRVKTLGA